MPTSPAGAAESAARGAAGLLEEPLAWAIGANATFEPAPPLLAAGTSVTAPGGGFVLKRVPNPRYRPPSSIAPALAAGAVSRIRALDYLRAQYSHHGLGAGIQNSYWELSAGEQYRNTDAIGFTVSGENRFTGPELRAFRIDGQRSAVGASLGDVPAIAVDRLVALHRLRGATVRLSAPRGAQWLALGGVPTPFPGSVQPRLGIGGVAVSELRFDDATLSVALLGFGRGRSLRGASGFGDVDSLAGRGGNALFAWRVPTSLGKLGGTLGAQLHDLDGHSGMAAHEAFEWSLTTPALVASLRDERNSHRARVVGAQRFVVAPRREDRWNVQTRWLKGRAESHLTGVVREGGEADLASRTVQLGASGSPTASAWYYGANATWDWRALTGIEDRRLAVHAGGTIAGGHALLARTEWMASADRDVVSLEAEASLALLRGGRLALEPRLGWDTHHLQQTSFETRLTWPFAWCSARLTGSLTMSATRDEEFRGTVREAAIALSWVPRLHDRGDFEVRRLDQAGRPVMEYGTSYEARIDRYENLGAGWFGARDSGRVVVRVVRSGSRSGVPDVLVTLDGKDLRFTDADGLVRFERVAPGVHLVAVEERTLPVHHQVVTATRAFVTVERGVVTPVTLFEVARPARRTSF